MSLLQLTRDKVWSPFYKHVLELQQTPLKVEKKKWYFGENEHADAGSLSRSDLGRIATLEPMIRKGIWKENKDIFGEGWTVEHKDKDLEVDEDDQELIDEFNKNSQLKYKLEQTGISCNIYGDGFLEKNYDELPDNTKEDDTPQTPLRNITVINAEYIEKTKHIGDTEYYVYKTSKKKGSEEYIHPNRLYHIVKKRLPGYLFGISDIYTCNRILRSKMNADTYFGEFIEWAGKGVFDVTLTGANTTDLKEAEKTVKRRNVQIHDENITWQVHNPVAMQPKDYYDYFFINIAATLDMPQHILTGVQPGQLTGSEIGLADYYKNIINLQELVFTPVIEDIYNQVLRENGSSFEDYEIVWNPIYIDETSEANILKMRSEAASMAIDRFVITEDEYRMILKEGIQNLKGNIVLDGDAPEKPLMPLPVEQPLPADKTPLMDKEQKLRWERERLLGLLEINKQDERLKESLRKDGLLKE